MQKGYKIITTTTSTSSPFNQKNYGTLDDIKSKNLYGCTKLTAQHIFMLHKVCIRYTSPIIKHQNESNKNPYTLTPKFFSKNLEFLHDGSMYFKIRIPDDCPNSIEFKVLANNIKELFLNTISKTHQNTIYYTLDIHLNENLYLNKTLFKNNKIQLIKLGLTIAKANNDTFIKTVTKFYDIFIEKITKIADINELPLTEKYLNDSSPNLNSLEVITNKKNYMYKNIKQNQNELSVKENSALFNLDDISDSAKILTYPNSVLCPKTILQDSIDILKTDLLCLEPQQYLNDSIIDFYLKYCWFEKVFPSELKNKIYIFSSFFYNRLVSKITNHSIPLIDDIATGKMSPKILDNEQYINKNDNIPVQESNMDIENDLKCSKTTAQKLYNNFLDTYHKIVNQVDMDIVDTESTESSPKSYESPISNKNSNADNLCFSKIDPATEFDSLGPLLHSSVKKWTKNIDIFKKEYIIIPVNKDFHWFLVVIVFPPNLASLLNKTNKCNLSPLKRPCISKSTTSKMDFKSKIFDNSRPAHLLVFDSLFEFKYGPLPRYIRAYLNEEFRTKYPSISPTSQEMALFDKHTLKTVYPKVPQQNNFSDCGLYLLHYFELLFGVEPAKMPDWSETGESLKKQFLTLEGWSFTPQQVRHKRRYIRELILHKAAQMDK